MFEQQLVNEYFILKTRHWGSFSIIIINNNNNNNDNNNNSNDNNNKKKKKKILGFSKLADVRRKVPATCRVRVGHFKLQISNLNSETLR